jgi:hypothetical protein
MPVAKILLRNFLTNLVLAPIVGTALAGLFYGQPLLVIWIDIAGVPAVVYALVSTSSPVVILTALGNLAFWWLSKHRFSMWKWQVMGACLGAIAGSLAGLAMQRATAIGFVGALTGAVCGSVQAVTWWRGIRDGAKTSPAQHPDSAGGDASCASKSSRRRG